MPSFVDPDDPRRRFKDIRKLDSAADGCNNAGISIVYDALTDKLCVEKRLHKEDITNQNADREMDVLCQLRGNENILQLVECEVKGSPLTPARLREATIWTEYCELGSLKEVVNHYLGTDERIPEIFLRHVLKSLAEAVCYCQQGPVGYAKGQWNTVYHRDITLRNVFLASEPDLGNVFLASESDINIPQMPRVVLGDFGLATTKDHIGSDSEDEDDAYYMSSPFDQFFAAPEFPHYNIKSDVYQIGAVMYCLMYKVFRPYDHRAPVLRDDNVEWLDNDVWDQETFHEERYSEGLIEMVSGCLVADSHWRCDVDMLLGRLETL